MAYANFDDIDLDLEKTFVTFVCLVVSVLFVLFVRLPRGGVPRMQKLSLHPPPPPPVGAWAGLSTVPSVYTDGSVLEKGKAGAGFVIPHF